ncbi:hypothetical protein PACILC2_49000 [Paenibacillus cisolokensis]|uniref:Uncharacterized protein n=1 Tax=Paenibacillus cisolokensis TaxID=1658519 RepID=A0ABQ4NDL8_9BACL|nr:hypothetical protein PACILC2_49000 [Paenibacillus cisolokensis]
MISKLTQWNEIPVKIIIKNSGTNDNNVVTNDDNTLERGKKYLGTYTFRINCPLAKTESMAKDVDSEKIDKQFFQSVHIQENWEFHF